MTKAEIANAIRDFSLDIDGIDEEINKVAKKMREFADHVEFSTDDSKPWEMAKPPEKKLPEPGLYRFGEER